MVSRVFLLVKSQTESKEPILKVEVTLYFLYNMCI